MRSTVFQQVLISLEWAFQEALGVHTHTWADIYLVSVLSTKAFELLLDEAGLRPGLKTEK